MNLARWLLPIAAVSSLACAPTLPPATRVVTDTLRASEGEATITFFWPVGSCDPAGHYAVAHDREGLIAKIGRGTRIVQIVEPGEHVFWVWNPVQESAMQTASSTDVALTRIVTQRGGSYFVRLAFGEWDDGGPRTVTSVSRGRLGTMKNLCVGSNVALVAVGPDAAAAADTAKAATSLPVLELDTTVPHDERDVQAHRALAEARFARLRDEGRALSVVDGRGDDETSAPPAKEPAP